MIKDIVKSGLQPIYNLKDTLHLLQGLSAYHKSQVTPDEAYQAMIKLHGQTNGQTTRMLANIFSKRNPKPTFDLSKSFMTSASPEKVSQIVNTIKEEGYCIFEEKLPTWMSDEIEQYVSKANANTWIDGKHTKQVFDPANPKAQVYKYEESELLSLKAVQTLISCPFFQAISAEYINATPILCSVNSWYSSKNKHAEDDHGGQLFHFDMSRAKWLNFFVYLNDVGTEDGPHCYVRKSHLFQNKKAKKLLKRGYARISDEEIAMAYGKDNIVELTGPKCTIMAVDTIGFHRGKVPQNQHRLIFEMIYASSLFGGQYQTQSVPSPTIPALQEALKRYPSIYQRFLKQ